MLTFQSIYEEVQDLTADSSSTATTKHKARINETYALFLRKFNKRTSATITTVASTQSYEIPNSINKISSVKGTVSSIDYPLTEILNEDEWNELNNQGVAYTSAIPTNYYIQDNNILVFPTPSDAYTITVYGTQKDKILSQDNYTTGNITTLANGGTTVTGSGTTWTSAMVGRYIKIDSDGYWYRISAVSAVTTLTLEKAYEGTAIAAGSEAYTIAEIPLIPEEYHYGLVYKPCWLYYLGKRNSQMAAQFKALYDEVARNIRPEEDNSTNQIIKIGSTEIKNINDYPQV